MRRDLGLPPELTKEVCEAVDMAGLCALCYTSVSLKTELEGIVIARLRSDYLLDNPYEWLRCVWRGAPSGFYSTAAPQQARMRLSLWEEEERRNWCDRVKRIPTAEVLSAAIHHPWARLDPRCAATVCERLAGGALLRQARFTVLRYLLDAAAGGFCLGRERCAAFTALHSSLPWLQDSGLPLSDILRACVELIQRCLLVPASTAGVRVVTPQTPARLGVSFRACVEFVALGVAPLYRLTPMGTRRFVGSEAIVNSGVLLYVPPVLCAPPESRFCAWTSFCAAFCAAAVYVLQRDRTGLWCEGLHRFVRDYSCRVGSIVRLPLLQSTTRQWHLPVVAKMLHCDEPSVRAFGSFYLDAAAHYDGGTRALSELPRELLVPLLEGVKFVLREGKDEAAMMHADNIVRDCIALCATTRAVSAPQ